MNNVKLIKNLVDFICLCLDLRACWRIQWNCLFHFVHIERGDVFFFFIFLFQFFVGLFLIPHFTLNYLQDYILSFPTINSSKWIQFKQSIPYCFLRASKMATLSLALSVILGWYITRLIIFEISTRIFGSSWHVFVASKDPE